MLIIHNLSYIGFVVVCLLAAISDARTLRIPNWMSLFLLVDFLIAGVASAISISEIAIHMTVGVGALVIGFILFFLRMFGGGDAKLFAAISLWMGWPLVINYCIAVMFLGGAVALLAIILRKGLGIWPDWVVNSARGLFEKNKSVPYGLAIVAGAFAVIPRMTLLPEGWLDLIRMALVSG